MNIEEIIRNAAKQRKTVIITYHSAKGVSTRETEPYEIKGGSYFGYCYNGNNIKNFLLCNISSAVATENSFSPRWEIKL